MTHSQVKPYNYPTRPVEETELAIKAYVFINLGSKDIKRILTTLKAADEVISAEAITGPYDIIVTVQADHIDTVGQLVTERILNIAGIDRTLTCFVLHL